MCVQLCPKHCGAYRSLLCPSRDGTARLKQIMRDHVKSYMVRSTSILSVIIARSGPRDTSTSCVTLGRPLAFSLASFFQIGGRAYSLQPPKVTSSSESTGVVGGGLLGEVRFELHIKGWKENGAPCSACPPPGPPLPLWEEEFHGLSGDSEFVDGKTCAEDSVFIISDLSTNPLRWVHTAYWWSQGLNPDGTLMCSVWEKGVGGGLVDEVT